MVEGPVPPLSSLAQRAIEAEHRRSDGDDAMQARVMARLAGTIAVGAAAGAAAAAATAGTASAATGAGAGAGTAVAGAGTAVAGAGTAVAGAGTGTVAGAGVGTVAGAGTAGAGLAVGVTVKTIPWLVLAFAVGGGTGAAIHARVATPEARPPIAAPTTSAPSPPPIATREPSPPPSVSAPPPEPSRAAPPTPVRTAAPSAGPDVDLAAERALIDRARMALARSQSSAALDAVDAHAKSFPRGRLAEEREAIAIQALSQAGRAAEARARADRFRAAYPNSVFGAAVDAVVPPR